MRTKYTSIIAICSIAILLLSLDSCTEKTSKQSEALENKMELVVYDSIDLPYSTMDFITDYSQDKGLFAGFFDNDIFVFSRKELQHRFNHFGGGPEQYNYLFSGNVGLLFNEDSTLVLNSFNRLKYYSFAGDFIKSTKIDDCPTCYYRKLLNSSIIDSSKLLFKGNIKEPLGKDVASSYDRHNIDNFFIQDINLNTTNHYGSFPKESIISKEKKTYRYLDPKIVYNSTSKCVDVLYSAEPRVFRYSIQDASTYSIQDLHPERYSKMQFEGANQSESIEQNESKKKYFNSSYYEYLFSKGDTIITVYRPSIDKNIIDDYIHPDKPDGYFNLNIDHSKHYLNYYIDWEKQTSDMLLPNNLKIKYIGNSKNIVCIKWDQELSVNGKPVRRYYFCKLVPSS
ncbi:MAG: hypothetical protein ACEPOV_01215 [Hyphomicrobiales bacterium]